MYLYQRKEKSSKQNIQTGQAFSYLYNNNIFKRQVKESVEIKFVAQHKNEKLQLKRKQPNKQINKNLFLFNLILTNFYFRTSFFWKLKTKIQKKENDMNVKLYCQRPQ